MNAKRLLLLFLFFTFYVLRFTSSAQAVDIGKEFGSPYTDPSQVGGLVSTIISNLYILAGVILLVLIVLGGIGIIAGAGQNDPQKVAQGRKAATMAFIGFLIIFASYWIIQIIESITGVIILK